MNKVIPIFIILILIIFSCIATFKLKERYPSIIIDEQSFSNVGILKYDETGCTEPIPQPIILNDSIIKEEDQLEFTIILSDKKGEVKAGFGKEKLINLKEGENKIGLFYYKNNKNYVYLQNCQLLQPITKSDVYNELKYEIKRPSFVDSWLGLIVVFLGFFILFGEAIFLLIKILKISNKFK